METPIFINAENFFILGHPIYPPRGFKYTNNKDTGEEYPLCCKFHEGIFVQLTSWFDKFPNCCDGHIEISRKWFFKKENYTDVVEKILNNLAYTQYLIADKINNEDWYEDITDYIEYSKYSFGQPTIGASQYASYMKGYLQNPSTDIPIEKQKKLIDFIYGENDKSKAQPIDVNVLFATYETWLKAFPFELTTYFGAAKKHFENILPLLAKEPVVNRYSGMAKSQLHTKEGLIEALIDITELLLVKFNGIELNEKGLISNAGMLKLELAEKRRKLKLQQGYFDKENGEMKPFYKAINEWLADEMEYLTALAETIKQNVVEKESKKSELMRTSLEKYSFSELPKVKDLSSKNKEKLFELVCSNGMPYAIAMFDYLGFLTHLEEGFFKAKYQLNIEISKWFGSDKDGRSVKGNINSLVGGTESCKSRYTAYQHKQKVINDYEALK